MAGKVTAMEILKSVEAEVRIPSTPARDAYKDTMRRIAEVKNLLATLQGEADRQLTDAVAEANGDDLPSKRGLDLTAQDQAMDQAVAAKPQP